MSEWRLLLPMLLVLAPHMERLPWWISLTWLACAAGGEALRRSRRPPLGPTVKLLLALAGVAGVLFQFGTVIGPAGGVALLVFLTGIKLLELEGPRDRQALLFVGCFLLVAHFLDTQSLPTAAWMSVAALALVAGMAAVQDEAASWQEHGALAARLLLLALPLALLLFVLFPRISQPLWSLPQQANARTGLSDRMAPGEISRLILSNELALRAEFPDPQPNPRVLYWRGPVLWDYDGREWRTQYPLPPVPPEARVQGEPTRYNVTLEPHQQRWLLLLGMPAELPDLTPPAETRLAPDLQWQTREPVTRRQRYDATAWLDFNLDPDLPPGRRARALALPDDGNPRARALAAQWREQQGSDVAIVDTALGMIRQQGYAYTLTPPPLGREGVDGFLFDTRRGFCEHYAGAFVFLMRAAGVPARVVTGYQGGEFNPLGRYWMVRGRDAHAWAEVWLAGRGWVQVDPTAAVAPSRVEQGIQAALPVEERSAAMRMVDAAWLRGVALGWDMVNNHWNLWVLGYNQERQRQFLSLIAPWLAQERVMLWALGAGMALLALAGLIWLAPRSVRRRGDDAQHAQHTYERFCQRLARRGLTRQPGETPEAYSRRAVAARPDLAIEIDAITRLYLDLRYGSAGDAAALRRAVARFRPAPE